MFRKQRAGTRAYDHHTSAQAHPRNRIHGSPCYDPSVFQFRSTSAPEFLPDLAAREWIATRLRTLAAQLHDVEATQAPQLIMPSSRMPVDLDGLFDLLCAMQEELGQADLEFTLLEASEQAPQLPKDFSTLGDPSGQLLHTAFGRGEYVLLYTPTLFKKKELLAASVARELGRMAIHQHDGHQGIETKDMEADSELAAIILGLGVWVANGSYLFENSCCGGGCGVDLRGLRTGLSMPEACFATALDGQRKGVGRRAVTKHLSPTQKSAFKTSWKHLGRLDAKALAPPISNPTTVSAPTQAEIEAL